jgi:hypothetical protein
MQKNFGGAALVKLLLPVAAVMMGFANGNCGIGEDYSTWTQSKDIVINTSGSGCPIAGNLTNFPYLVRLDENFDFSQAMGKGQDIRFAKSSGAHLAYEIESWDSAGKSAAIWVKVDTVFAYNATQAVKMYWGKSGSADSSNGPNVFSRNFRTVYHFNEDPSTGTAALKDHSAYSRNATTHTMAATDLVAGVVGKGYHFGGTNSYAAADSNLGISGNANRTVSLWVNTAATDMTPLVELGDTLPNTGFNLWYNPTVEWYIEGVSTVNNCRTGEGSAIAGKWGYVTYQIDSVAGWVRVFMNDKDLGVFRHVYTTTNAPVRIGGNASFIGSGRMAAYFDGLMDELQISDTVRSPDWIKLCYFNQKPGPTGPATIKYPQKEYRIIINQMYDPIIPTLGGDFIDSITIDPMMSGLSFDQSTGEISGIPFNPFPRTQYIITAWNSKGHTSDTISIIIEEQTGTLVGKGKQLAKISLIGMSSTGTPKVYYSIPGTNEVSDLSFTLYNCRGSAVWSSHLSRGALRSGVQSIAVGNRGRIPSGIYFIEMKAKGTGTKAPVVLRMRAIIR